MAESFLNDFRRSFVRGLAAVLPTLLTIAILIYVFRFVQDKLGRHINYAAAQGAAWVWAARARQVAVGPKLPMEHYLQEKSPIVQAYWDDYLWGVGFLLAIVAIYVVGRFVTSFVGRGLWKVLERAFFRLPVVKQIFPYIKQVTDFVLSEKKVEFSRVVMVEYPRKGIWSLGLVTGAGLRSLTEALGADLLTVFIPSTPTPVTGYAINVRREEVFDLPISIDEAIRFVVSGGVIQPLGQQLSPPEVDRARRAVLPLSGTPRKETPA